MTVTFISSPENGFQHLSNSNFGTIQVFSACENEVFDNRARLVDDPSIFLKSLNLRKM